MMVAEYCEILTDTNSVKSFEQFQENGYTERHESILSDPDNERDSFYFKRNQKIQ